MTHAILLALALCAQTETPPTETTSTETPPTETTSTETTSTETPPPTETTAPTAETPTEPVPDPVEAPPPPKAPEVGVVVVSDERGLRLRKDGADFFVTGMNWDYVPIGQNYAYSLWEQPDDVIEAALGREMPLLQRMHVNTIRQYVGVPSRWITYIYDHWGITTVLNHAMGRYGFNIDGAWTPQIDYSNPHHREVIAADIHKMVVEYKDTRGLLFWLLGNENNYGLSWASTEIEALPQGERDTARAKFLYSLYGAIAKDIKSVDVTHPVAMANGDLQYIDLIAQECGDIDIFGANVYRGVSVGDLFDVVKAKLGKPVVLTEFGADAFDAKAHTEDDVEQARIVVKQWQELYEQSAGKGRVGNAIGGMLFQWSDGWWKYRQTENLDVHDANASWPNGGYAADFVEGENNMNEEWWGICAKGFPDSRGLYNLRPRTAYHALVSALALPVYDEGTTVDVIRARFGGTDLVAAAAMAHGESAFVAGFDLSRVQISTLRLELNTFITGGDKRVRADVGGNGDGFDHGESFYVGARANPTPTIDASVTLNVLGNVALNPIDEIFYENRGRPRTLTDTATGKDFILQGIERIKVYNANATWEEQWFQLHAFYRTGHGHWGYDGDAFGLYREAYYGNAPDIYNADTPSGVEVAGKKWLSGLKLAFGNELWWGANPAVIAKYSLPIGPVTVSAMYTEQFARQTALTVSTAIPEQATRKAAVSALTKFGGFQLEGGVLWAGSTRIDQPFANVTGEGDNVVVKQDQVLVTDTLGAKAKLMGDFGNVHAYAQAAYMGLVAEGGPTSTVTYTGWSLRDSGSGNQANALAGVAVDLGPFQIAPNFLWQRPLVGPVPTGLPEAAPRNVLTDPFSVRGNRETLAGELLLVFDPTPATWLWAWDNDLREDAPIAASVDVWYRHQPTTQDAGFGFTADGQIFAFDGAPPPKDIYGVDARVVSRIAAGSRVVGHAYWGVGESSGNSDRFPNRYGADARLITGPVSAQAFVKFNDWGPFTYYRDFNITFPLQLIGDLSTSLGDVSWFNFVQTRVGVRGTWRALNGFSGRFCPDEGALNADGTCNPLSGPSEWGSEYELRTYLTIGL